MTDATAVVAKILKRLASSDDVTFRAGGRAVANHAVEHRTELITLLRGALGERREQESDLRRRGYLDGLLDMLITAEAALEPREDEARARQALSSHERLQQVLDRVAAMPTTPGDIADTLDVSAATGTRDLAQLRELGLVTVLPGNNARSRPHLLTPLGKRLATHVELHVESDERATTHVPPPPEIRVDPLTGTLGLLAFEKVLLETFSVHRNARTPLALLNVDIAGYLRMEATLHFTEVEECIRRVSDSLKDVIGPQAYVARYERDKFFALATSASTVVARDFARTIAARLAPRDIVCIGVSGTDSFEPTDPEQLRWASGEALKLAKERGPGTTIAWGEPPPPGPRARSRPKLGR